MVRQNLSGFCVFLLILLVCTTTVSGEVVKKYDPALGLEDLLLIGFSEVTIHTMSIKGNADAFETGNSWLKEDFAGNYRASLFANGNLNRKFFMNGAAVLDSRIEDEYRSADPSVFRLRMSLQSTEPLWDGWRFTGEGVYDPDRKWELGNLDKHLLTQPQEAARLELYTRLESDENGYIEGGSLHPSFSNTKFSLNRRSLFGTFADLHGGDVGIEAVAGKLEGKRYREGTVTGIRANGTSGPYYLANAPLTRGSEVVKVETRDRFDETTVLSSRTLTRDIDYEVDYLEGRILLYQPVASESVASDPNYIVISYDYQRENDDDLFGARVKAMPADKVEAGIAFLHRNIDDKATGRGEDEPENLQAADVTFDMDKVGSGYVEVAGSDNPDDDDTYLALRAGIDTRPVERVGLKADFQRIEDDYRSFTNSDLNPNKNQQRLGLTGTYDVGESQSISASFRNLRGLAANGQYNPYAGRRNEDIFSAGFASRGNRAANFGLRVEQRDIKDRDDASHEDSQQRRFIADINGERDDFGPVGLFGYGLHYELITFRNQIDGGLGNTNTNQAALTLSSRPFEHSSISLTQKIRVRRDTDIDSYDDREDGTFVTLRIRPHRNVNSLTTLEYKRWTIPGGGLNLWQDDPRRIDRAGTFALEYIPITKIKALGKIGRYDSEQWTTDSTWRSTDDFLLGQVTYFPNHHLSFGADTEYRRLERKNAIRLQDKVWDLGLRVNWNRDRLNEFTAGIIRRWQRDEESALPTLTSTSYILLLSGSVSVTREVFARASIKSILLRDALDDEKTLTRIEVGYDRGSWYRVSAGYERIENETELYPDRYYRGHGLFLRLTGKI